MSDDSNGKESEKISVPTPPEAVKELESGRVLVKTPDLKFRKSNNGKQLFAKGNGSLGRPKGSKNKMSVLAAQLIGDSAEKVIKKIIKKALDDKCKDQALMLKLLIERIAPSTKAIDVTSINRDEKTITISVEGVTVHENTVGTIEAEIVDFIEEEENRE